MFQPFQRISYPLHNLKKFWNIEMQEEENK